MYSRTAIEFVQHSSDETTRKSGQDVYGWGLRQDFLEAEPWQTYALKPIGVGIHRGAAKEKPSELDGALKQIAEERKNRNNRPVRALGLFTLWDDARDIATYVRNDANRSQVQQALGLSGNAEPLLFAGSGAFSPDFYREGGPSVVGAYLLSPFFVGESSATWREFRATLSNHQVDSLYPDPYLALGYDSVSMIASCLSSIGQGKKFGSARNRNRRRPARRIAKLSGCRRGRQHLAFTGHRAEGIRQNRRGSARTRANDLHSSRRSCQYVDTRDIGRSCGGKSSTTPWWRPDLCAPCLGFARRGARCRCRGFAANSASRRIPESQPAPAAPCRKARTDDDCTPCRAATGEATWLGFTAFLWFRRRLATRLEGGAQRMSGPERQEARDHHGPHGGRQDAPRSSHSQVRASRGRRQAVRRCRLRHDYRRVSSTANLPARLAAHIRARLLTERDYWRQQTEELFSSTRSRKSVRNCRREF